MNLEQPTLGRYLLRCQMRFRLNEKRRFYDNLQIVNFKLLDKCYNDICFWEHLRASENIDMLGGFVLEKQSKDFFDK